MLLLTVTVDGFLPPLPACGRHQCFRAPGAMPSADHGGGNGGNGGGNKKGGGSGGEARLQKVLAQ